jgi:hypothetical protein
MTANGAFFNFWSLNIFLQPDQTLRPVIASQNTNEAGAVVWDAYFFGATTSGSLVFNDRRMDGGVGPTLLGGCNG